jgi:hypothetical protein
MVSTYAQLQHHTPPYSHPAPLRPHVTYMSSPAAQEAVGSSGAAILVVWILLVSILLPVVGPIRTAALVEKGGRGGKTETER